MVDAEYYAKVEKKINDTVDSWRNDDNRYQTIDQRLQRPPTFMKDAEMLLARGKYSFKWRDIPMMKDCKEMMIYQSMLNDIRPRTIIETGTYLGASALWFADLAKGLDLDCHVYTVEKFETLVRPSVRTHPGVTCIFGDANNIREVMPADMLNGLPHPWLVVEDCHVNVMGLMEHFGKHMASGDYFAIEDTNHMAPFWDALHNSADGGGSGDSKEETMKVFRPPPKGSEGAEVSLEEAPSKSCRKHDTVVEFLQKYKTEFMVDSFYTDLFGFNGTCTWDGYIRKM